MFEAKDNLLSLGVFEEVDMLIDTSTGILNKTLSISFLVCGLYLVLLQKNVIPFM